MPDTFAEGLEGTLAPVVVWDFPDQQTRFVTRDDSGLSHPVGWTVFTGCLVMKDDGSRLDIRSNRLTVGDHSFKVSDVDEQLSSWINTNDQTLSLSRVTRKLGWRGLPEAEYQESEWVLSDYLISGRRGGAYEFELRSCLKPMTAPLYEDFEDSTTYQLGAAVGTSDTTITLEESPKGKWREPGFAVIYDDRRRSCELVEYQTIGGTDDKDLQTVTRQRFGVTPTTNSFTTDNATVRQVWVKQGNPIDLVLQWLTSTSAGTNGSYDQGDGDGLGDEIPVDLVDVTAIEAVRDAFWPVPTGYTNDVPDDGTAVLFVESSPIDDLKAWIEEKVLRPFALFPVITAENKWSIESVYKVTPDPSEVGDRWLVDEFNAGQWKRNFESRINLIETSCDNNPESRSNETTIPKKSPTSIERYGRSKALELDARGCRTGKLGFPDYGSEADLDRAASRWLLELANPGTPLKIKAFFRWLTLQIGSAVTVNVPNILALPAGSRGKVGGTTFLVTRVKVIWDAKRPAVELELRRRRAVKRPAVIAPASVTGDYSSAGGDQVYAHIAPGSEASYANGDEAHTVV